jgi:hypothetical protein
MGRRKLERPGGQRTLTTATVGAMTYDTTLGLPLWWSGANRKDAAGAAR